MLNVQNGKVGIGQVLLPVGILAFVVFLFLGFQFTQILHDRETMHQAMEQQEKPLSDAQHVQEQLRALMQGTQTLASKGDKSAQTIVERMVKLGILKANATGPGMSRAPAQGRAPLGAAPQPPAPEEPSN